MSSFLSLNTMTAAINNITFFPKVSQLVNTHASPKQPQSETGLKSARYKVNGVMKIIRINAKVEATDLLTPKNRKIPTENSIADRIIPPNNGKKEGNQEAIPNAER